MCENKLESIGKRIRAARKEMGLTQEEFAEKYGYTRTTLAKMEKGLRDIKSTEIVTLAEQLGVSCDYLLGRSRVATPDEFLQEIYKRYGLTEEALKELVDSDEKVSDSTEDISISAVSRRSTTKSCRKIINSLLSKQSGRRIFELLATYFFAEIDNKNPDDIPRFVLPWNKSADDIPLFYTSRLSEEILRETVLYALIGELKKLREEI